MITIKNGAMPGPVQQTKAAHTNRRTAGLSDVVNDLNIPTINWPGKRFSRIAARLAMLGVQL